MTPRLKRHSCKFFTNPMFRNSEKRLEHKENQTKYRKMTRKSLRHVRILNVGYCYHISCNFSLLKFCTWYTILILLGYKRNPKLWTGRISRVCKFYWWLESLWLLLHKFWSHFGIFGVKYHIFRLSSKYTK